MIDDGWNLEALSASGPRTIREFAERVLFAETLEEKLIPPPKGELALTDDNRGTPLVTPHAPGRPRELRLCETGKARAEFPREHQLKSEQARGHLLHFLANHELLATELMALALLKFPDAPPAFRQGLLRTLAEEQWHTRWYLARMAHYGVEFGSLPVSGFFWNAVAGMETPLDYVSRLPLTFEQANLDFSLHYRDVFARAGDDPTAALLQRIHDDEIGHVGYGLNWFRKWKDPDEDDWTAHGRRLVFPLSLVRAKGKQLTDRDGRRRAGLSESYIRALELLSGSRGRTPEVFMFNPEAESDVLNEPPDRPTRCLRDDLDVLPAFLARAEDVVLVRQHPRLEHLEKWKRAGLEWPEWEVLTPEGSLSALSLLRQRKLRGLRPWAWAPSVEKLLGPLRSHIRGPGAVPGWNEGLKALFSKATVVAWRRALGEPESLCGEVVTSLEGLHAAMARLRRAGLEQGVIKPAFGASGRSFRRVELWTEADQLWAQQVLTQQGALVVEPWLERVADFSVQLEMMPEGGLHLKGFTRLVVNERGRFQACEASGRLTKFFPPEAARAFALGTGSRGLRLKEYYEEQVLPLLAERFQTVGFYGACGLDAFLYRVPPSIPSAPSPILLRAVVELNPRYTMGRVAWELRRLAHPDCRVRFRLATLDEARQGGFPTLAAYAQKLEAEDPWQLTTRQGLTRLERGTLVLNDPIRAQRFLGVLSVLK